MTDTERNRRWSMAREHYRVGGLCFDSNLFGASATRSYYAAYRGMWVAFGDPLLGRWRHHGMIQHFALDSGQSHRHYRQCLHLIGSDYAHYMITVQTRI